MQFTQPILFEEAIKKLGSRTAIASALTSKEWSAMPLKLRERAFFSARVEDARFLHEMQSMIGDFLEGVREVLPNGEVAIKVGGRAQFIELAREKAIARGLGPLVPEDAGTIKDITSERRLALIFDTQTKAARDFGNWKQGMDTDELDQFPAQRFVRVVDVSAPRPLHEQYEGEVRLKTDLPFWLMLNSPQIGGFGVPYGPWGFNSGMDVEDVEREEAEELGLIEPLEVIHPIDQDFNAHLEASVFGYSEEIIGWLRDQFGDQITIDNDRLKWSDDPSP